MGVLYTFREHYPKSSIMLLGFVVVVDVNLFVVVAVVVAAITSIINIWNVKV